MYLLEKVIRIHLIKVLLLNFQFFIIQIHLQN